MLARIEKPAVAKTPPQAGFANIPPLFATDLFNRQRRFSAARFQQIHSPLLLSPNAGAAVGATR
jgi:hypothetical protein